MPTSGGGLRIPLGTWIAGGAAIVTLSAGIAFGVTALNQSSEFDSIVADINSRSPSDPELPQLRADGHAVADAQHSNALIADVMLVAAAVGAAVAVYFFLTQDDSDPATTTTAFVTATPIEGGGAVVAAGRF